jgi:hypothetical protein
LLADDTRLAHSQCVGCHALSRDGSRIVASQGGQNDGLLVYVNDMTVDPMDAAYLTSNGDDVNRIQFASFSPDAERFVAVFGDTLRAAGEMQFIEHARDVCVNCCDTYNQSLSDLLVA